MRGALTASTGLFALVFGLSRAETDGWGDPARSSRSSLRGPAAASSSCSAATEQPLLPLRVVTDRDRGASFLAIATASAGLFGLFLFLTYYLQLTKGFSAFETGLAFLPMSVSIAPTVGDRHHEDPAAHRPAAARPGRDAARRGRHAPAHAAGADSAYASHVLPSLILIGIGFGLTIAPSFATATHGIPARDAGVASAMVNTSQQIGGSIGTALLSSRRRAAA